LFSYFTEQLPCKITKQVKKAMLTYNEKFLENLSCLEESEMSDKTSGKKILRGRVASQLSKN
jgi:hypothetical protein